MKLIVGLGNPGKQYEHSRHNCGFDVVDLIADALGVDVDKEDFFGVYGYRKLRQLQDETIILFKPMTFMNLSGKAVQAIKNYFKIELEDIIIIYDDMDTNIGQIRVRFKGSAGGHNGLTDIIRALGTEEINRIRVGIGKPEHDSVNYVLSKPKNKDEIDTLNEGKEEAKNAAITFIKEGINAAMNKYNHHE